MAQSKIRMTLQEFGQSASSLLSRFYLATRAGLMFGGKRDLYNVFGYNRVLRPEDLYAKFERQDITARIVNLPVDSTWSAPPELVASNARFNTDWREFLKKQPNLWATLARADRLLAFGRYSVLVMGLPGDSKRSVSKAGLDNLSFLQPYGETAAVIKDLVTDTSNPRFGKPKSYEISIANDLMHQSQGTVGSTNITSIKSITFDESRVIHLAECLLDSNLYGVPRLQQIFNLLDDVLKTSGGAAETFWLIANRGMQVDVDKEMNMGVEDEKALSDELEEFQHQLRRYIRTRGVKVNQLGADPVDPRGAFNILIQLLAGATGIPQRILLGSEAGQLASEQDRANWAQTVEERRKRFAEPLVLRPFVQKLADMGILTQPVDLKFEWPDAFHMSPLETAQMMAQKARAIVNLSRRYQYGDPIITDEEARSWVLLPEAGAPPKFGLGLGEPMPVAQIEDPEAEDGDEDPDGEGEKAQRPQGDAEKSGSGQRQQEGYYPKVFLGQEINLEGVGGKADVLKMLTFNRRQ